MVVTYGTMKRASLVLTVARNSLDLLLLACDQANAVSELIPVKPDGIINGCCVMSPGICNLIYFAYLATPLCTLLQRDTDIKGQRSLEFCFQLLRRIIFSSV